MRKENLNIRSVPCQMEYVQDAAGHEMLLKDGKFQVMMEWEKAYMQACIDALKPFGNVLEVGFGCGYSATHIQTYRPKSHTIIEYHPVVAAKARQWAKEYSHVTIIEDTWQHALDQLGVFDCIFFDDYPIESEEHLHQLEEQAHNSFSLLEKGKELIASVEKQLPFLTTIQYNKEDIHSFLQILEKEHASSEHLYRFVSELKERGQITSQLFEETIETLVQKGFILKEAVQKLSQKQQATALRRPPERLMKFLRQCLLHHMRKGSRFSCFLSDPASTWENQHFVQEIIANPDVDYKEKEISVSVPEHCTYYKNDKALVIVVEKMV
jgi:protein-L-isoaspartate O-methyltransferase